MAKIKKYKIKKPKNLFVKEPGVAYVTATEVKNRLGEVLEIAREKDVIITKTGKPMFRLSHLKKKLTPKEIIEKYAGSMPDLEIDQEFRESFSFDIEKRLKRSAKLLSD